MNNTYKPIGYWLLLGLFMIYIQMVLGGITRLTGSGLSITEWDPIMGAIPPLNDAQWQDAFAKYQRIPQYHILNSNITLSGFKSLFFWEWFHRLWARLIAVAFIAGLVYFLWKKKIDRTFLMHLLALFVLGAFQGLMGWIMVQSGLKDNIWVNHLKLTLHLLFALATFSYLLWIALQYALPKINHTATKSMRRFTVVMIVLLLIQISFGGIMAGLKAALAFNTWPMYGTQWIPSIDTTHSVLYDSIHDKNAVQFIHRTLAYTIALVSIIYTMYSRRRTDARIAPLFLIYPFVIMIQIALGIFVIINTPTDNPSAPIPVVYGVLHQAVGIFIFLYTLFVYYLIRKSGKEENSLGNTIPLV